MINKELLSRLKKASTIDDTDILTNSEVYNKKDMVDTGIPALNIALSGEIDGGLTPGSTVLAGPSKHFKSAFAMIMAGAYLKKYEDAIVMFYDSEFGIPEKYLQAFGIDKDRVLHMPISTIEELKNDLVFQLEKVIKRGDKICIVIDSIGNLASNKEVEDAINQKSVADMTRAKAIKSLFRAITPKLTLRDIPLIAINHTYTEMSRYPREIVSGGRGIMYSANNVWIIGRQQEKDKNKKLAGYNFIIRVEKSRFLKEKSEIPITVLYDSGINKWSGLFDLAIAGGYLQKEGNGYCLVDVESGEVVGEKMKTDEVVNNDEFWESVLENTTFKEFIKNKFQMNSGGSVDVELLEDDVEDEEEDEE